MKKDVLDEILADVPRYTLRDKTGKTIYDDVDIALKTPVIQEGTPLNRELFESLLEYEELGVERIDNTYQKDISRKMFMQLNEFSADGVKEIIGQFSEPFNDTGEVAEVKLTSNQTLYNTTSLNTSSKKYGIYAQINGSNKTGVDPINTILKRVGYSSDYYLFLGSYSGNYSSVQTFWIDMKTPRKATLKMRAYGPKWTFYGSDDDSTWDTLGETTSDTASTVASEKAYRYYKVSFESSITNRQIYYMYFSVEDKETVPDFENAFTYPATVTENKKMLVKTPDVLDMENVTKNTINGIEVEEMLNAGNLYELVLRNNVIKQTGIQNVAGKYTGNGGDAESQGIVIDLGFKPLVLFIADSLGRIGYSTYINSAMCVNSHTVKGLTFTETGFIAYGTSTSSGSACLNTSGAVYQYFAIG